MTHPTIQALSSLETLLAKSRQRYHTMPVWWRDELTRFYDAERRQSVWRVGRRGGKSSTICRVVVCEAYYGAHEWPDDDEGVVMIISADQKQAKARLRSCAVLLREMKIEHDQTADELRFQNYRGQRVVIRVHSASISSVVGCTCICAVLDEVARWGENDRTGNPSEAILESLIPTMATQPHAKIFMISSPMSEEDLHAKAFDEGNTSFQTVHFAPTWVANPTLTEDYCHKLAKTEREFLREYAAIPQSMFEEGFYELEDLTTASDPERAPIGVSFVDGAHLKTDAGKPIGATPGERAYFMAVDPAFRRDAFGVAIAHAEPFNGRMSIVLDYVDELRGKAGQPLSPETAIAICASLRTIWPGPRVIRGDQASADVLRALFAQKGIVYVDEAWTQQSILETHERVRTLLRDRRLFLPKFGALQRQMVQLGLKRSPTGADQLVARDGHVGDAASAAVAAIAEAWEWAGMGAGEQKPATNRGGITVDGLHTDRGGVFGRPSNLGDKAFTESERCAICGELRADGCAHLPKVTKP